MPADRRDEERFPFRSVVIAVFAPTLFFAVGEGALLPFIPILAGDLGASLAIAGVVAAMLTVGELLGSIPGGALVARLGERATMIYSGLTVLAAIGAAFLATEWWHFAVCVLVMGLGTVVFGLARHAFMTTYVPLRYRARALSSLGGVFRLGTAIGPLLSSGIIALGADTEWVLGIFAAGVVIAVVILFFLPDPSSTFSSDPSRAGQRALRQASDGIWRTLRNNWRVLGTIGTGAALLSFARSARMVLIPLWAISIGTDPVTVGLVVGIAGVVDFALFFTSGWLMDRFGRLWAIVPSIIGLGLGFALLAFTHDIAMATEAWIIAAGLLALANGLGSGIIMTLGADLAPQQSPAPFLGAWRLVATAGSASAPVVISVVIQLATIAAAAGVLVVVCAIGAVILVKTVPRGTPE